MINIILGLNFLIILFNPILPENIKNFLRDGDFITIIVLNERKLIVTDKEGKIYFDVKCGIGRGNAKGNFQKKSDFDRITPPGLFKITHIFKEGDEELKKLNNIFWGDIYKEGKPIGKNAYGAGFVAFDWTNPLDREKPKKDKNAKGQFRRSKEYYSSLFSIAIHGTNRDDWVGIPSTGGCIRLKNEDIKTYIEKFAKIGGLIYIVEEI